MKRAWMLALLAPMFAGTEEPAPAALVLKLRDGSVLVGTSPMGDALQVSRDGKEVEIPWEDVWSLSWSKKKDGDLVLHKDGAFLGEILSPERLRVDTGFGTLDVPAAEARSLRLTGASRSFADSFDDGELRAWRHSGTGRWASKDRRLHGSSGHPPDALQFRDELDGAWDVEIDVDSQGGRGVGGLGWHVGAGTHPMLLVHAHAATAYLVTNGRWQALQSWRLPRGQGSRRLRLAVDGGEATVSVDGRKLGDVKTGTESGRFELLAQSGEVVFDNFRIEK